jgi:hypothetical protein
MVGWLIGFTEGERLGLLALLGTSLTAIASICAAWLANRVRKENSAQHDTSHALLSTLAYKIDDHGHKLERVHTDLQHITARVDHAHDRIDRGFR